MIDLLAIGYITASSTQLVSGIPQIRKLIKAKNADAISFTTWSMWGIAQSVCLAYNIRNGDMALISISALWLFYYALMVIIIAYYRWPQYFVFMRRDQLQPAAVLDDQPQE